MSTSRSPSNLLCTVDLGAQYITATPYYSKIHERWDCFCSYAILNHFAFIIVIQQYLPPPPYPSSFYQELLTRGIFKPLEATVEGMNAMEEGTVNYVTPDGMSSVVKHFLKESGWSSLFVI